MTALIAAVSGCGCRDGLPEVNDGDIPTRGGEKNTFGGEAEVAKSTRARAQIPLMQRVTVLIDPTLISRS